MGKVNSGIPQVPAKGLISSSSVDGAGEEVFASIKRQELPIWAQRDEIIEAISQNQVHSARSQGYMPGVCHFHEYPIHFVGHSHNG